ncbi:response regulator transcription factor [Paenibacillus radicis (ex Xue et al. 2023)]|uniref:Response regulator n=1 Tax=Paenibacillus radicis (ex Xue et al. 2023) TaxID=2972489 RepID=A0ABT1YNT2_9BACL|nr:response regulator [Paenibacillus radicis (ex Xue et al. 2023)]MCR8634838.1 response regulator [Paenibacillus radicis (ex Xue et al. 2023)]
MLKAIITDDETIIKKSLKMIIERTNLFEVIGAFTNGRDALEFMQANPVDLLITDIRMPVMDGLNLISALREMGNKADVIILTGYGEFEYAQRAIRYGVTDYLLKPVVLEQLQKMLEQIASKRKQQMMLQAWRQESLWYCRQQGKRLALLLRDMDGAAIDSLLDAVYDYISRNNSEHLEIYKTFYVDFLTCTRNELVESLPDFKETLHLTFTKEGVLEELKGQARRQIGEWMQQIAAVRNHGIALIVKKALVYIQAHIFDEDLSLLSIANELNLSVSYTSECIKEAVGVSFTQYVINVRMEQAKVWLADSSCKMYEVAFKCGYADYAHFTKMFKKHYGYSPKEYRKRLNGSFLSE